VLVALGATEADRLTESSIGLVRMSCMLRGDGRGDSHHNEKSEPAAPAPAAATKCGIGEHRGPQMKTPTMPDDKAISVSPASTHGMPVAPSAARLCRFAAADGHHCAAADQPEHTGHQAPHFHQASRVFTVPGQARWRLWRRVGHGRRELVRLDMAVLGSDEVVHDQRKGEHRQVSYGVGGVGKVRPAAARIAVRARRAERGSGTAAGVVGEPERGDERDMDDCADPGLEEAETAGDGGGFGPAVADHGQHGHLAALPDVAATALVACCEAHAVLRQATMSGRPADTLAGWGGSGSGLIAPMSQAGCSQTPGCWRRRAVCAPDDELGTLPAVLGYLGGVPGVAVGLPGRCIAVSFLFAGPLSGSAGAGQWRVRTVGGRGPSAGTPRSSSRPGVGMR